MRPILALLALAVATVAHSKSAEWQGHTGSWCLVMDRSQMCLPETLKPTKIGANYATFREPWDSVAMPIRVSHTFVVDGNFESGITEYDESEIWQRIESETYGTLTLTAFESRPDYNHGVKLLSFFLEVEGVFEMEVSGDENGDVREIAMDLAEEWKSQSRIPPVIGTTQRWLLASQKQIRFLPWGLLAIAVGLFAVGEYLPGLRECLSDGIQSCTSRFLGYSFAGRLALFLNIAFVLFGAALGLMGLVPRLFRGKIWKK